ncbi:Aminoglycoside phosphotransferase [Penicillium malachiteum]|uniref:Aminoglycoside phosphotransferase n=1 Tax=Penicillium malachiteum TaxID=1324776 RepID=UPI002548F6D0|nr:Aminoglycoside phosphotransferase [Penicillium malachiteum]KAJ5715183.1 Aminoglycoside phosphotransferase [Penicillium malachiteum]
MPSGQEGHLSSLSAASLSTSKTVNNTVLYRCLTLLAIRILRCIRPREGNVLMLTDRLCVKYGRHVHLSEASTMQFISQHTSIPVPKVFCAFTRSGWTYILMERIKGDIIGSGWELIEGQNKSWPLIFTHGDLSSLNILVRGDDIVGIIDWETAGWYPSYWEYTSAHQVNPQNSFWVHEIEKFLQPMPEELAMERIRQIRFGDV